MSEENPSNPLTPAEANALRIWQDELDASCRRTYAELAKRPRRLHCDSFRITPEQMRKLRIPREVPRLPDHLHYLAPQPSPPRPQSLSDALRGLESQAVPVRWHGGEAVMAGLPDPAWPILVPRRFVHGGWRGSAEPSFADMAVPGWTDDPHDAVATARRALRVGDVASVRLKAHWFRNASVHVEPSDLAGRRAAFFEALAWEIVVDPKRVVVGAGFPVADVAPFAICGWRGGED
jgi:hypothetical protein